MIVRAIRRWLAKAYRHDAPISLEALEALSAAHDRIELREWTLRAHGQRVKAQACPDCDGWCLWPSAVGCDAHPRELRGVAPAVEQIPW